MTSYLTETDGDDEIPVCKHCDICNLELKSVDNNQSYQCTVCVCEKLEQKTYLDLKKFQSLFDTQD